MKARVDADRCAGHGDCVSTCSAVFTLTADGYAEALVDEIPAQYTDLVTKAAQECPEHAIEVDEG